MIETKNAKCFGELSRSDSVAHPDHYAGDGQIECMDAMRSMMSGDQPARFDLLRSTARGLAATIQGECPESREKSLAFTKLEECVMWANAAIARNETEGGDQ